MTFVQEFCHVADIFKVRIISPLVMVLTHALTMPSTGDVKSVALQQYYVQLKQNVH